MANKNVLFVLKDNNLDLSHRQSIKLLYGNKILKCLNCNHNNNNKKTHEGPLFMGKLYETEREKETERER